MRLEVVDVLLPSGRRATVVVAVVGETSVVAVVLGEAGVVAVG